MEHATAAPRASIRIVMTSSLREGVPDHWKVFQRAEQGPLWARSGLQEDPWLTSAPGAELPFDRVGWSVRCHPQGRPKLSLQPPGVDRRSVKVREGRSGLSGNRRDRGMTERSGAALPWA